MSKPSRYSWKVLSAELKRRGVYPVTGAYAVANVILTLAGTLIMLV